MTSIVIPHYELHDMLKNFCLPNLYLYADNVEILIVDNGSKKPLKVDEPFKTIRSKVRVSFARACNLGAEQAKGDVLLFLNNDVQVLPFFLEPMLEALRDEKSVICGSKILSADGKIQHIGIVFGKKRLPYHDHMGEEDSSKFKGTKETIAVTGACMAVKSNWFKTTNGFDESFPDGNYEDVSLCLTAKKQGLKVKVALDSKVIHLGGATYGLHPEEHTELLVRRNWEILSEKWKGEKDSFFGINKNSLLTPREEAWGL